MGNKELFRHPVYSVLENSGSYGYSGRGIQIKDPQAILVNDEDFCPIVTELVRNCLEKGASLVMVEIGQGRLVIEDDIFHPLEDLERILANIRSERPRTTKDPDTEFGFPIGGVGIISVRKDLLRYGGTLSYEVTDDMRIRAVASWLIS